MTHNPPIKVLYVDDEPINTTLFKINFKKHFEVILSMSGEEALAKLEANEDIDVVVSDFKMPGLNGVEFIREANEKYGQRPSVILTGFDTNKDIEEAMQDGNVNALLHKPMDKEELIETVNKCYKNFHPSL
ncbi:response regulator [Owenweeksia hongkongensis]|uniref:CheY-like receiver domain-containing protein n=1 Tax=Owenweeksia hongkongensis (strain DSM 17368 / CIP 108786 / JCM 12287 / NRRL B-23963 / UST20020801) TaxID=926562 RepID=G8R276_OWEHD|nr:response regulator [Owenweeksia hongkongensis]AEV31826.1 CheY-like receiver domain-containing protein [Owenweeksia hongkongensis DSM 17368]